MLLMSVQNIRKYFTDRLIFELEELKVYDGDRIGIVGLNGAGKTTLMNVLSGNLEPDEGTVRLYGDHVYITQLGDPEECPVDGRLAGEFGVEGEAASYLSGGEATRLKIAGSLSRGGSILFADEPTCNLDMKGIELLEQKLLEFDGALLIISHDRLLLDSVCNQILEIESGKITVYSGNYSAYRLQKEAETARREFEYEQYISERRKLEEAILERKQRVREMKKTPSRMGNSEARLHKREVNRKKARLDRAAKGMESRIEKLEVKERPKTLPKTRMDVQEALLPVSRTVLRCRNLSKCFGSRELFHVVSFEIRNGSKVALIGGNGTGKTTMLGMLLSSADGVEWAKGVQIGYFSQKLDTLDEEADILENVMKESIHPEAFVRTLLARLLFKREDVFKKVKLLSGGERVKVAFARIFAGEANLLVLDEPTNYLDTGSQEALEAVLQEYNGTVLFVSHDRAFINRVADRLLILEEGVIRSFDGTYRQYRDAGKNTGGMDQGALRARKLLLETRLSLLGGRLSMPAEEKNREELDREYRETVQELKELEGRLNG